MCRIKKIVLILAVAVEKEWRGYRLRFHVLFTLAGTGNQASLSFTRTESAFQNGGLFWEERLVETEERINSSINWKQFLTNIGYFCDKG